jgi:hypothetical protein
MRWRLDRRARTVGAGERRALRGTGFGRFRKGRDSAPVAVPVDVIGPYLRTTSSALAQRAGIDVMRKRSGAKRRNPRQGRGAIDVLLPYGAERRHRGRSRADFDVLHDQNVEIAAPAGEAIDVLGALRPKRRPSGSDLRRIRRFGRFRERHPGRSHSPSPPAVPWRRRHTRADQRAATIGAATRARAAARCHRLTHPEAHRWATTAPPAAPGRHPRRRR